MKKFLMGILFWGLSVSAMADILLPPREETRMRQVYQQGQAKCPKDKPLFDGNTCYSCDEPKTIHTRYDCESFCPQREKRYECGASCALKAAPAEGYVYTSCRGWEKP